MQRLISTEWIKIFPDDASIRRDMDGDGLTDLVEARLGTDPNRADTDGDGVPDALDPCPNSGKRLTGETEQIIAACVEARFFAEPWGVPAVLSVEGVKPFKLYGYDAPLLWSTPGHESPLARQYGGGVNMISFQRADEKSRQNQPLIEYSADHKTARVLIRRYSGGLNGDGNVVTLKKIAGEWFVVDIQLAYVS
jgi:hypothetical protein